MTSHVPKHWFSHYYECYPRYIRVFYTVSETDRACLHVDLRNSTKKKTKLFSICQPQEESRKVFSSSAQDKPNISFTYSSMVRLEVHGPHPARNYSY